MTKQYVLTAVSQYVFDYIVDQLFSDEMFRKQIEVEEEVDEEEEVEVVEGEEGDREEMQGKQDIYITGEDNINLN